MSNCPHHDDHGRLQRRCQAQYLVEEANTHSPRDPASVVAALRQPLEQFEDKIVPCCGVSTSRSSVALGQSKAKEPRRGHASEADATSRRDPECSGDTPAGGPARASSCFSRTEPTQVVIAGRPARGDRLLACLTPER